MGNFLGIEGIEYKTHGDMSDSIVEYKGMSWSAWEILDAIQCDIDEDVKSDDCPKGITVEEWVTYSGNAESVKAMLDDMIYSQQTEEKIEELKSEAGKAFNKSGMEFEFTVGAAYDIAKWTAENTENREILGKYIEGITDDMSKEDIEEYIEEYLSSDELLAFAKENNIEVDTPYVIFLQNYETASANDKKQAAEKIASYSERYAGIYTVVVGVEGTVFEASLDNDTATAFRETVGLSVSEPEKKSKAIVQDDIGNR